MAQITITINSREYAIVCEDGQEARIMSLSRILDEKARLISGGTNQTSEAMLLAMVGLLIADELSETKKKLDEQQNKVSSQFLEQKDLEISDEIKKLTTTINSIVNML